jgi:hypothetical protein
MRAVAQRLGRLEARLTDATRLVPRSEEWFTYWECILHRLLAGEDPVIHGRFPLEVIYRLIERADREAGLIP